MSWFDLSFIREVPRVAAEAVKSTRPWWQEVITEMVRATRSIQVLGRMEANTPMGMETMSAKRRAEIPRVMVTPIRSRIIFRTGSLK